MKCKLLRRRNSPKFYKLLKKFDDASHINLKSYLLRVKCSAHFWSRHLFLLIDSNIPVGSLYRCANGYGRIHLFHSNKDEPKWSDGIDPAHRSTGGLSAPQIALALQILFLILLFALGRAGDFMLVAVLATTAFTVLFIAALFCFNSARP